MKQLPRYLKSDEGFSCTSRQSQQNPWFLLRNGVHGIVYGDFLIIACTLGSTHILKGNLVEFVTPLVKGCEGLVPELIRCGELVYQTLGTGFHADPVYLFPVAGEGRLQLHFLGVVFSLCYPFTDFKFIAFRFDCGELYPFIGKDIISFQGFRSSSTRLDFTERDDILPQDFRTLNDTPPAILELGVDQLRSGIRFVHQCAPESSPLKAF